MNKWIQPLLWLSLAGLVLAGCSQSGTTPAGGAVEIRLTDAPSDYLSSAVVVVSQVYLTTADSSMAGADSTNRVEIYGPEDPPLIFNLLELRDGLEAFLGQVPVPAAVYHQLRLVVDEATVTLAEGYSFADDSNSKALKVPSAMTSGIKVDLAEPLEVEEGQLVLVVVDFDVDENFKIQGNPDTPAGIKGVLFTPTLKEKRRETTERE